MSPARFMYVSSGGGNPPANLLLDDYPALGGYSLRKLRNNYSGFAIRARSGGSTQDIGFDGSGNLDTTSLLSFASGGNATVEIWYDQSGNGFDIQNLTTSQQPRIVNSGTVDTSNGNPAIFWDGINKQLNRSDALGLTGNPAITILGVVESTETQEVFRKFINMGSLSGTAGQVYGLTYYLNQGLATRYNNGTQGWGNFTNTQSILSVTAPAGGDYSATQAWKNGSALSSINLINGTNTVNLVDETFEIGSEKSNTVSDWEGYIQEILVWNADQTSNILAIDSDVNSYYSAY